MKVETKSERGFFSNEGLTAWSIEWDSFGSEIWIEINGEVMYFQSDDFPFLKKFADSISEAIKNGQRLENV